MTEAMRELSPDELIAAFEAENPSVKFGDVNHYPRLALERERQRVSHRPVHAHWNLTGELGAPLAATIEVVAVRFKRGHGCCDQSPVREVVAYYDVNGTFLAERDPS